MREMKAAKLPTADVEWQPATDIFGERCVRNGDALARYKVLSDRRAQSGGVAYLLRFTPPPGKLIKVVAVARSDEHIYILAGGHCNKAGEQLAQPGTYGINPEGRPHSAFFAEDTQALVIYAGEPDQVSEFEIVEPVDRA